MRHKKRLRLSLLPAGIVSVIECSGQKAGKIAQARLPDFSKLNSSCFAGSTWNDPHVLRVGDRYVMCASSDVSFNGGSKIFRPVSGDRLTGWPQDTFAIFDRGSFTWPGEEIRSPAVLLEGTTLKFWFAGHCSSNASDAGFVMEIGASSCAH